MEKLKIGVLTKSQGLKGEFRVKIKNEFLNLINQINEIIINNNTYIIEKKIDRITFYIFKVEGINSINQVEELINCDIFANFDNDSLANNNYFLNYDLYANHNFIAKIVKIDNFGASDVYTLSNNKMFAYKPDLVEKVDNDNKILYVYLNKLNEVII